MVVITDVKVQSGIVTVDQPTRDRFAQMQEWEVRKMASEGNPEAAILVKEKDEMAVRDYLRQQAHQAHQAHQARQAHQAHEAHQAHYVRT